MAYIIDHEGYSALFKGIGPQLLKGLLVQGFLMMTKERVEFLFVLLFAYIRTVRQKQLKQLADRVREKAMPIAEQVVDKVKEVAPIVSK